MMKPVGLRTVVGTLARPSPITPLRSPPAWFSQSSASRLADHQPAPELSVQEEGALAKLFRPSVSGRKFQQLAQDLQQRSQALIKIENIRIEASLQSHGHSEHPSTNQHTKVTSGIVDNDDATQQNKSRRKLRKNFEEDPEFKFERKRGKRHVMAALKQSKLNPNHSSLSEKIHLSPELDLSIRSGGQLEKLHICLPPPPATTEVVSSAVSSTTSSLNKPAADHSNQSSQDRQLTPIEEFVKMYLGPLVWSNPQVDISLIYNQDQLQPKITFWNKEEADEGLVTDEKRRIKEVEVTESMNRSEILQLILNFPKN